jgi:Domain of unknown function (DUF362)
VEGRFFISMSELQILSGSDQDAAAFVRHVLPVGSFRRIVIKPNWVKHQEHPDFPINALVTSSHLIDLTIQACLDRYPDAEKITVCDVPLQTCDWSRLIEQSGLNVLMEKYGRSQKPVICFLDLRRERWKLHDGFMELSSDDPGDPLGYAEVVVDQQSQLEEISRNAASFRVSDYDSHETVSQHCKGRHRYLIARTILEADLCINLPKMKTHQKAGITGALKNLVGINGSKAHLVHHQLGFPSQGGDEFPESASRLFYYQARLREHLQKRSKLLFRIGKTGWEVLKRIRRVRTVGTRENLAGNFYIGSGSWYGNDSIWRMVYDLNMILLLAPAAGGRLESEPQRTVFSLLDGLTAGEGNGPLQPLPVETHLLAASANPFLVDFAMSKLMGFDWKKIRLLSNYQRFQSKFYLDFTPERFRVHLNGVVHESGLNAIPVQHHFLPPPSWKNHIELATTP